MPNIDNVFFEFDNTDKGLFFTIFFTADIKKEVVFPLILKEIEHRQFKNIDINAVEKALDDSGTAIRIGPKQHDVELDGKLLLRVTSKGDKAYITIFPPQEGGVPLNFEKVMQTLKENNIVAGIKEDNIRKAIDENLYNREILAAEEIPPISEVKSYYYIGYKFDLDIINKIQLKEDEKGRIDFKELNLIKGVKKGDLLATKILSFRKGIPGKRINGEVIPYSLVNTSGENLKLIAGKNTVVSDDGMELRAAINGYIVVSEGKINIEEVYKIKGNIDYKVGNINFPGTIVVEGSIEDGFKVIAEGDILVKDTVGAVILKAKGSIIINGGIMGKGRALIRSKGDIISKFIENAHVIADKNVVVDEEILHSRVAAGESVYVLGKKGVIIGGLIRANEEITAKVIGNYISTLTKVEAGVWPRIRDQLNRLKREFDKCIKQYKKNKLNIKILKDMKETGKITEEKTHILQDFISEQNILSTRFRSYAKRKSYLVEQLIKSKKGAINIQEIIYPGVELKIRSTSLSINRPYKHTSFIFENNEIRAKLYRGKEMKYKQIKRER